MSVRNMMKLYLYESSSSSSNNKVVFSGLSSDSVSLLMSAKANGFDLR